METAFYSEIKQQPEALRKTLAAYAENDFALIRQAVSLIASKLEPLVGQIPGLLTMEVRRCYQGCDYALDSEFERAEDIPAYRAHPLHKEAKKHFFHLLDQRHSADYEV